MLPAQVKSSKVPSLGELLYDDHRDDERLNFPRLGGPWLFMAWIILAAGCGERRQNMPKQEAGAPVDGKGRDAGSALSQINHFVIIYMENHSFDSLYGELPGADGIMRAPGDSPIPLQVDLAGEPYSALPRPPTITESEALFTDLPNRHFPIPSPIPADIAATDLIHRFYTQQAQIDGGSMRKFVAYSDATALTLGYYKTMTLPVPQIAAEYTVCDRFFHSAFGGSFLNHMWLVSARTPEFPNAPLDIRQSEFEPPGPPRILFPATADGIFTGEDNLVTADGFAVNTLLSINTPHPLGAAPEYLLPSQTFPTIGDRLSSAGLSWAWYSGGWDETLAYIAAEGNVENVSENVTGFQYHHQPFVYFARFADGSPARAEHLKDENEFLVAAAQGELPAVSFVKPTGVDNEHPGYADLLRGENHLATLIRAVMSSPNWADTAIIITYDEYGGYADHVPPPVVDRWGPAGRVPTVIISPYANKQFVDHTPYETVSILATIERRWGLEPLTSRDANANDLSAAFISRP